MNLQAEASSLKKGESLLDTVRTLEAMRPDGLVIRHSSSGAPEFVAERLGVPVINAGDGTHEHPTQALLDALTIRDRKGQLEGWNLTILGDVLHSRVARSNIHLLSKFGVRTTLCGPAMWIPRELETLAPNVRRVTRIEEALDGADVIMALRVQTERLHEPALAAEEYILRYQLTPQRLQVAHRSQFVWIDPIWDNRDPPLVDVEDVGDVPARVVGADDHRIRTLCHPALDRVDV